MPGDVDDTLGPCMCGARDCQQCFPGQIDAHDGLVLDMVIHMECSNYAGNGEDRYAELKARIMDTLRGWNYIHPSNRATVEDA